MKFEIGEIAILVIPLDCDPADSAIPFDGEDVEVIGAGRSKKWGFMYLIKYPDGDTGTCTPRCLRKKKPPAFDREDNQPASWDDCIWKPETVTMGDNNG